jgi:thiamine biosynthesis lipoprotein
VIRAILLVLASALSITESSTSTPVHRDAYLMGTRASLTTYAATREAGMARLDAALRALEATEAELSTWKPDSAISALNRTPVGRSWQASAGLCDLLADVYRWQRETNGAFDPAIGPLIAAWRIHDEGAVPTTPRLTSARERSGLEHLRFDRERCIVTRHTDVTVDVGGFGKGEALDRAAAAIESDSLQSNDRRSAAWMIDLGGQISVGGPRPGNEPWLVDLAQPVERDRAALRLALVSGSLSTSGGSERDLRVRGRRVGHILDPRTGQPAPFDGSVTVWHERGLIADILSTALYVMGRENGLVWAEARGISAVFLTPVARRSSSNASANVRVAMTPEFRRLIAPE